MYHALCLLDLLHVMNVEPCPDAGLRDIAARGASFLAAMAHPNGEVFRLNDSAWGIAPPAGDVVDYARRVLGAAVPGQPPARAIFRDTGYAVCRDGHDLLVVDAGDVGPSCQPGHAHGDIFSFELSLDGCPVIVDSGVCEYEPGPMRDHVRSTAAHNTIEVDGRDQCEFWAAFRVARRGRPRDVGFSVAPEAFRVSGWHDGYHRLSGKPTHRREFTWRDGVLVVRDHVWGRAAHRIASRLHVHPACTLERCSDSEVLVHHGAGHAAIAFAGPGRLSIEEGWFCPEFGRKLRSKVLTFRARASQWQGAFQIAKGATQAPFDLNAAARVGGRLLSF